MASRGRPTELTEELVERISPYLRAGNTVEIAAGAVGVSRRTLQHWIRTGHDAEVKKGRLTRYEASCLYFLHTATQLQNEAMVARVAGITSAGRPTRKVVVTRTVDANGQQVGEATHKEEEVLGDWRALAWLTERLGKRFNLRVSADLEDEDLAAPTGESEDADVAVEVVTRIRGMRERMGGGGPAQAEETQG